MRSVILFRTHVWDDFTSRQFAKIPDIPGIDRVILANNTGGQCPPVEGLPFVTFEYADFAKLGLEIGTKNDATWYNADYPLYYYASLYPDYDYYILWEYDVVVRADLATIMQKVQEDGIELVAPVSNEPLSECIFLNTAKGVYDENCTEKMYFQFAIFSKKAVDFFLSRRLELSRKFRENEIKSWPHCELFIGSEVLSGNVTFDQLAHYGAADHFSYFPAILEDDIEKYPDQKFLHPVLDTERFVKSVIVYEGRPERYFNPASSFHKTLRRFPSSLYARPLYDAWKLRGRRVMNVCKEKIPAILRNATHAEHIHE